MSIYELLEQRGYVYQCTNLDAVKKILDSDVPTTFYLGIDPTADSLHIGHFFALMMFMFQWITMPQSRRSGDFVSAKIMCRTRLCAAVDHAL